MSLSQDQFFNAALRKHQPCSDICLGQNRYPDLCNEECSEFQGLGLSSEESSGTAWYVILMIVVSVLLVIILGLTFVFRNKLNNLKSSCQKNRKLKGINNEGQGEELQDIVSKATEAFEESTLGIVHGTHRNPENDFKISLTVRTDELCRENRNRAAGQPMLRGHTNPRCKEESKIDLEAPLKFGNTKPFEETHNERT